jgi:hypothetical protein
LCLLESEFEREGLELMNLSSPIRRVLKAAEKLVLIGTPLMILQLLAYLALVSSAFWKFIII